mmetsp:Transcript_11750/g.12808  ORF Transcript_11750/g.12808 Transcript_11750/m.12808 type:complete len:90 (+) Transcript_11750:320-589(+)
MVKYTCLILCPELEYQQSIPTANSRSICTNRVIISLVYYVDKKKKQCIRTGKSSSSSASTTFTKSTQQNRTNQIYRIENNRSKSIKTSP